MKPALRIRGSFRNAWLVMNHGIFQLVPLPGFMMYLLVNVAPGIAGITPAAETNPGPAVRALRVVTFNVWSGLDYRGSLKFGEFETPARREARFSELVIEMRELDPDVVLLQEVNPAAEFASRLADSLGFDEIHQVCNAGIKLLGIGAPSNLEEGIATLARKELRLRQYDTWKLSGPFGLFGDFMSVNFSQAEFAQVGEIRIGRQAFLIVNLHLSASPPLDGVVGESAASWYRSGEISRVELERVVAEVTGGSARRSKEIEDLIDRVRGLPPETPVVVGGDFNSVPSSGEMSLFERTLKLRDSASEWPDASTATWDPEQNPNIAYSTCSTGADGENLDLSGRLSAVYDTVPRRVDYIFTSRHFGEACVKKYRVVFDSPANGTFSSDHFGVAADISVPVRVPGDSDFEQDEQGRAHFEPLPILSYDTDTRLGYGAKLFFFDLLRSRESLDIVLFNSTKGERWYRAVFSYPDFEWRQGKTYPLAVDLTFDYDKWLKNNFFGIGNRSPYADRKFYTREPAQLSLAFSRGFTPHLVGQAIAKYMSIRNSNFEEGNVLTTLPPAINSSTARFFSGGLNVRYDTRNSFINPTSGMVVQGETEYSPDWKLGNTSFGRFAGWFQYYSVLFYPQTVFALRLGLQQVVGADLPVQVLTSLGGTNTLRGYPQDRFLDKAAGLVNAELRLPIFWRFGGVVGVDAGKVWPAITSIDIQRWAVNPVAGLRLYMDNFVVRADVGFGRDGTGFYFNFGQMF